MALVLHGPSYNPDLPRITPEALAADINAVFLPLDGGTMTDELIINNGTGVSLSTSGPINSDIAYNQNGDTILRVYGNTGLQEFFGLNTVTLVGKGAGASLPSTDYLTTAVGWMALNASISTNTESTAVGFGSQRLVTTGSNNTTLGVGTMFSATTSVHNIAIGTDAMRNGNPSFSMAIGQTALLNDNNSANIAIGDGSYRSNLSATGVLNLVIGWNTFNALSLTNGSNNVVIGSAIAPNATTASNNTLIGHLVAGALSVASVRRGDDGLGIEAIGTGVGANFNNAKQQRRRGSGAW